MVLSFCTNVFFYETLCRVYESLPSSVTSIYIVFRLGDSVHANPMLMKQPAFSVTSVNLTRLVLAQMMTMAARIVGVTILAPLGARTARSVSAKQMSLTNIAQAVKEIIMV